MNSDQTVKSLLRARRGQGGGSTFQTEKSTLQTIVDEGKINNFTFRSRYKNNQIHGRNSSTLNHSVMSPNMSKLNDSLMSSSNMGRSNMSSFIQKKQQKLKIKSNLTMSHAASLESQKLAVANLDSSKFLTKPQTTSELK